MHKDDEALLTGQTESSLQVRNAGLGNFFLPRWGSRVRIPSSAPENEPLTSSNAVVPNRHPPLWTNPPTKNQRNVCWVGIHGVGAGPPAGRRTQGPRLSTRTDHADDAPWADRQEGRLFEGEEAVLHVMG
jgi:hypothetical protein